jgi:hypothetical protein
MLSKRKLSSLWRLLLFVVVIPIAGCAGAYHDYQGCCIPYLYCTPPPLPYVSYEGCHCPTPGTSLYFEQHGSAASLITESDHPIAVQGRPNGSDSP